MRFCCPLLMNKFMRKQCFITVKRQLLVQILLVFEDGKLEGHVEPGNSGNTLEILSTPYSQTSFLCDLSSTCLSFSDRGANIPCEMLNIINWKYLLWLPFELVNLKIEIE